MAVNRYYSSTAVRTTLASGISDSTTSITVNLATGYPNNTPFTIHVDLGTSSEEIMEVTGVAGTTFMVTRGVDGSAALSHSTGATVQHGTSARDFREGQEHIAASSGVHGVAGDLVGATAVQTLTNKTLTTPTIASLVNAQHDHSAGAEGGLLDFPRGLIRRTDTMNLTTSTTVLTQVTLQSADYQIGGTFWTTGTDITLPFDGFYLAHLSVVFQNAGTNAGMRLGQLKRNSDEFPVVDVTNIGPGGSTTEWVNCAGTFPYVGESGETFSVVLRQSSGSTMAVFSVVAGFTLLTRTA